MKKPNLNASDLKGLRVLLVDDEPLLRELLCEFLESHSMSVLQAQDGVEALETFRVHKENIDVVISDSTMPLMGGEELYSEVRQLNATMPFIFISGHSESEIGSIGERPKGTGYIYKPIDFDKLLGCIARLTATDVS